LHQRRCVCRGSLFNVDGWRRVCIVGIYIGISERRQCEAAGKNADARVNAEVIAMDSVAMKPGVS
jgi:hypothetical protein